MEDINGRPREAPNTGDSLKLDRTSSLSQARTWRPNSDHANRFDNGQRPSSGATPSVPQRLDDANASLSADRFKAL